MLSTYRDLEIYNVMKCFSRLAKRKGKLEALVYSGIETQLRNEERGPSWCFLAHTEVRYCPLNKR